MAEILVVDDEPRIRAALALLLEQHGHVVQTVESGEAAVAAACRRNFDLAILDLTLPGMSGVETLTQLRAGDGTLLALFITAHGSIRSAIEAIKAGGFDYLTKPFDNDQLLLVVNRALERRYLGRRVEALELDLNARASFPAIIGRGPTILEVLRQLAKVAPTDATVLICGETGTGKELAALSLHRQSRRAGGPFIAVNCGAIPPSLAESELFGHERGAFTDAREKRAGRFEAAHGGTLFLDEIGELPLEIQAKLLRAIQEREVTRLGAVRPRAVDVRIIAATNRDLEAEAVRGGFREDLYWRINQFPLRLPALRDRLEDIEVLVDHFLDKLNTELAASVTSVAPEVIARFKEYSWPGNIRELENMLRRAMILMDGNILHVEDLPEAFGRPLAQAGDSPRPGEPLKALVDRVTRRVERSAITQALRAHQGRRGAAAEALGISRRTLLNKLKALGLVPPDADDSAD